MSIIEKALEIALEAHKGQVYKAGEPYILHPLRVMLKMEDEISMCTAILHDVLEDSDFTAQDLVNEGIPEEVVEAIKCLTKGKDEDYFEFIDRVKTTDLAVKVKKADIEDNLNISRLPILTDKDIARIRKYREARERLRS